MTALAPTLQAFFTDRLALQRQASGHTVAAYRDALRMLIVYAAQHAGKAPSRLDIADLDAQTVGAFLNHLENERGNSARTRNARLAAIHSLFGYAAVRHPEHAADIQRVLAIPPKRYDKALITYLAEDEITACWPPRTWRPGPDGATRRCWSSPARPGCAPPSSPASPSETFTWAPARTSAAWARAGNRG